MALTCEIESFRVEGVFLTQFPSLSSFLFPESENRMEYTTFPIFSIPTSIRRRLPRLSFSRVVSKVTLNGDLRRGLASFPEPQICHNQIAESGLGPGSDPDVQPSISSNDGDFDSERRRPSPDEEMGSTRYEVESGLQWNRVIPGESNISLY